MTKREQVQKDALDIAVKHKRCGLGISMGVGKTLIGLKYIEHHQGLNKKVRVLIVAPKLSIFDCCFTINAATNHLHHDL
jgi:superfamily II DNA or RNA helicase